VANRDVVVEEDSIRLAQLLKLAGVIDTGGEAKVRLAAGEVRVNGEVEVRRGRQLRRGDVVEIDDQRLRVR
jgi:ribosome-associated protein